MKIIDESRIAGRIRIPSRTGEDDSVTTLVIEADQLPDVILHIYGCGKRPAGRGSMTAWIDITDGRSVVELIDDLTPIEAHYKSLLAALGSAAKRSYVHVYCSSTKLFKQFCGARSGGATESFRMMVGIAVQERNIALKLFLIPVGQNAAAKVARQAMKACAAASEAART